MKNDKSQFVVRTSDFYLSLFICHLPLSEGSAVVRKNVAAKEDHGNSVVKKVRGLSRI